LTKRLTENLTCDFGFDTNCWIKHLSLSHNS